MTLDELDILIARTLAAAPHLRPILDAVKAGALTYAEWLPDRVRILQQRPGLPMVVLRSTATAAGR